MLNAKISPSMMCANLLEIKKDLEELKQAKVEYLHIDIMDGVFVPNITLSNDIAKNFRKVSNIPFDYHLMIVEPTKKIDWFELKENDMLSFHVEAEENTVVIDENNNIQTQIVGATKVEFETFLESKRNELLDIILSTPETITTEMVNDVEFIINFAKINE